MSMNPMEFAEFGCEVEFSQTSEPFFVAVGAISYACLINCIGCEVSKQSRQVSQQSRHLEVTASVSDMSLGA